MLVVALPRTVRCPTIFTEVNAVGPTAYGTVTAHEAAAANIHVAFIA